MPPGTPPGSTRSATRRRWASRSCSAGPRQRDSSSRSPVGGTPRTRRQPSGRRAALLARTLGGVLIVLGVLALAWVILVWRWQDPVTALYTHWKQHQLAQSIDHQ